MAKFEAYADQAAKDFAELEQEHGPEKAQMIQFEEANPRQNRQGGRGRRDKNVAGIDFGRKQPIFTKSKSTTQVPGQDGIGTDD